MEWRYLEREALPDLTSAGVITLDVETVSPDTAAPSLALNPHLAVLVDIFLYAPDISPEVLVLPASRLKELEAQLDDYRGTLVGQNFRYDLKALMRAGADLRHLRWEDTMHLHHLVQEEGSNSLGRMVKEFFNVEYKDDFWTKYRSYTDAPIDTRCEYGARDVLYTYKIYRFVCDKLRRTTGAREAARRESLQHRS